MKKVFVALFALLFCVCTVFAGIYNTVPLGHEAYRIIEYAEICGIIPIQSKVKPYDYSTVIRLLEQISASKLFDENGLVRVSAVMSDLDRIYGKQKVSGTRDFLYNGLYRTVNAENGNSFAIGIKGKMDESVGIDNDKDKIADLRNSGTIFIDGDLFDTVSYNMNASLKLDMLNPRAYLTEEFVYDADGDYFLGVGSDNTYINTFGKEADGVHVGFKASPEISASLFKNHLTLRFGSFSRDWGPGNGNVVLSATAPEFMGFEMQIRPVKWLTFSALTGSLNRSYVKSIYDVRRAGYGNQDPVVSSTDFDATVDVEYDNMFSIQRVEFNIKDKFQFALYESVVWKKRLELSYLNPFAIYWFAQSMTGDLDSLIGGFDFTWNIKKLGQLYFSASVDEFTADIKHLITNARNIVAFQGGLRMPGNLFGNFTTFTLQATYIPPFYGTHHYQENLDKTLYATSYVNKGFNLFYPLNPDSLELLLKCDMSLKKGWGLSFSAKDQMRSSQYSIKSAGGTDILDVLHYNKDDDYAGKKFFKNIWNNVLDINLTLSKRFDGVPVKMSVGLDGIFDWSRDYDTGGVQYDSGYTRFNNGYYNLGDKNSVDGKDWKSADIRFVGNILFTLYY